MNEAKGGTWLAVGLAACAIVACAIGCGGATGTDAGTTGTDAGTMGTDAGPSLPDMIGPEDRPAVLVTPDAHDGETALPLLVYLHGFGGRLGVVGPGEGTGPRGFYLLLPRGTSNPDGERFWNATPSCCDGYGTGVDDSGYLIGLVDELESIAPVSDVYFAGYSNGGFMSYRMACDYADRISAIASLAGLGFETDAECGATRGVSVLQVHGDGDTNVPYAGDPARGFPPAPEMVSRWAARNGCSDTSEVGEPLELDILLPGAETTVERYVGCTEGEAELWTIVGGGHNLRGPSMPMLLDWLESRAR